MAHSIMAAKNITEKIGKVNRHFIRGSGYISTMIKNHTFNIYFASVKLIIVCLAVTIISQHPAAAQETVLSFVDFLKTNHNMAIRYGVWRPSHTKVQGSVILLGGRSEFMEKYAETIGELNQRGYLVYSFDWRGQGLSTRMLPDRHKGFVRNYDDYIQDLAAFVSKIVKPGAVTPLVILAHSMGGHIALRYIHDNPGIVDRAVLVSPMIDILTTPFPRFFARLITRISSQAGGDHTYVIGSKGYDADEEKYEGNRLTSDPERFMDEKKAIAANPDLALGGVTYGWLSATFDSIDILTKPGYADEIKTPVLIFSAGSDRVVSVEAQKSICTSMPNCKLETIEGSFHEILKETDSIRSIFWKAFDKFTDRDL